MEKFFVSSSEQRHFTSSYEVCMSNVQCASQRTESGILRCPRIFRLCITRLSQRHFVYSRDSNGTCSSQHVRDWSSDQAFKNGFKRQGNNRSDVFTDWPDPLATAWSLMAMMTSWCSIYTYNRCGFTWRYLQLPGIPFMFFTASKPLIEFLTQMTTVSCLALNGRSSSL